MKRKIIRIDEPKCNGCGLCIPGCPEGALQIIDGKARLVSDLFCDGLGACIGDCPEGAISIEEREAEPYDEATVMERIIEQGPNVVKAHLEHLVSHNQDEFLKIARAVLARQGLEDPTAAAQPEEMPASACGCAGAMSLAFDSPPPAPLEKSAPASSQLTHWPVQMHLISPQANQYRNADLLLCADCLPFAMPDFHSKLLAGKALAIACPKLDSHQEIYLDKLVNLIDTAGIKSLTVAVMEVPCCLGLFALAQEAVRRARNPVPLNRVQVGIRGEVQKTS